MAAPHRHTPNCKALLAQLSEYLDGELEAKLCDELEQHLAGCDDCRVLADTTRKTLALYRRRHRRRPVELSEEAAARLWGALEAAGCLPAQTP